MTLDEMGMNLNEVFDVNGIGADSIFDSGLGIGAMWKFSCWQRDFAVELVNAKATMLGHDIECTEVESIPIHISTGGKSKEAILTRPESRGVVRDIFHRFAANHNDEG